MLYVVYLDLFFGMTVNQMLDCECQLLSAPASAESTHPGKKG